MKPAQYMALGRLMKVAYGFFDKCSTRLEERWVPLPPGQVQRRKLWVDQPVLSKHSDIFFCIILHYHIFGRDTQTKKCFWQTKKKKTQLKIVFSNMTPYRFVEFYRHFRVDDKWSSRIFWNVLALAPNWMTSRTRREQTE